MIQTAAIIGLGAVGGMYASLLRRHLKREQVFGIADAERICRYEKEGIFVNGERLDITYLADTDPRIRPADLLIFATKYGSLTEAVKSAGPAVGPDTIVMSFLNGVTSEEIIQKALSPARLLYATVQGMDSGKKGNQIHYLHNGNVAFGEKNGRISETVNEAAALFDQAGIPYINPPDMMRQLYNKWMFNVGLNQTCAYYACGYEGIQKAGRIRDTFLAAMEEARACAAAEGVHLTEEDVKDWLQLAQTFDPHGEPSMRQDTKAGRPTEAQLFGGTVREIAMRHNIDIPVNDMFCRRFL